MTDETKRIFAFFLCGLILIGWMSMNARKTPIHHPKAGEVASAPALPGTAAPAAATAVTVNAKPTTTAPTQLKRTTVELENSELKLKLDSLGGTIGTVELKKFKQKRQADASLVQMEFNHDPQRGAVRWDLNLNGQNFSDAQLSELVTSERAATFVFRTPQGLEVRKSYRMGESGFVVGLALEINNQGKEAVLVNAASSMGVEAGSVRLGRFNGNPKDLLELGAYVNDKRLHQDVGRMKGPENFAGNAVSWAGVMDRYFLAAMVPTDGPAEAVSFEKYLGDRVLLTNAQGTVLQESQLAMYGGMTQIDAAEKLTAGEEATNLEFHSGITGEKKLTLPVSGGTVQGKHLNLSTEAMLALEQASVAVGSGSVKMNFPARSVPAGSKTVYNLNLFLGPKDYDVLVAFGHQLDKSIDLGDWIGVIARPMLRFMKWSYTWIGNYGLAIILLTVLVRLLLYPLTHLQFKSMQKMQAIKPQMEALREKYKDKKDELNRQMMELFKREKVNPMGGCFPIVLQMPVFFALYRVLYNAIELRQAPFAFWLHDLSANDPYYVTPILLGGLMYVQQRMTPTTGMDPSQEMMMKFMPIMFSFFMLYLPSGLVLYIMVSTLLGLAQQWWVTRSKEALHV